MTGNFLVQKQTHIPDLIPESLTTKSFNCIFDHFSGADDITVQVVKDKALCEAVAKLLQPKALPAENFEDVVIEVEDPTETTASAIAGGAPWYGLPEDTTKEYLAKLKINHLRKLLTTIVCPCKFSSSLYVSAFSLLFK